MTRNSANSANADDSWEQLEADLFGIEVGKEHTAEERVASEPAPPAPRQAIVSVPKPIEEDDFGDFGAGLGEVAGASDAPPRQTSPARSRPKPTKPARPAEPEPVKPLPVEPVRGFDLADLDEGPTDEELDAASEVDEDDDEETAEGAEATAPEDDPYWDALANWNWQEDDRAGKARPESSRDRPRSGGRGDRSQRGSSRDRSGERRPPSTRDSRSTGPDDRGHSAPRRPAPERDRARVDETPEPVSEAPVVEREPRPIQEEITPSHADVKSRRQDRRRSRRHTSATAPVSEDAPIEPEHLEETVDDGWPAADDISRSIPEEQPRSRALPEEDLEEEFEEESARSVDREAEPAGEDDRGPRRPRRRRRRRRPDRSDRPATAASESAADEDIKHLEEDGLEVSDDEDLEELSSTEGSAGEDEDSDRPTRQRRPRRRRRGGRSDRPAPGRHAPATAARAQSEFDDEDEEEVVEAQFDDDEFDEDQDRQFVEEDTPARSSRRSRSRRSSSDTPFVRHVENDDEEDSEPEPVVSYEDVPSWEEAISYLLNPSMVEGAAGDRPERSERSGPPNDRGHRGGERSSRPPRRGPRRDA